MVNNMTTMPHSQCRVTENGKQVSGPQERTGGQDSNKHESGLAFFVCNAIASKQRARCRRHRRTHAQISNSEKHIAETYKEKNRTKA